MKTRIFKNIDGSVIYSSPSKKYQGGTFVNDLTKPIFQDVDDLTKPIMIEIDDLKNPIYEEVGEEIKIVGYQKKQTQSGEYEKKTIISGYEQKELTFEDCKFPEFTNGLEYIDVNSNEIHKSDSNTDDFHEMLHFDGDCKLENLKSDKEWKKILMPKFLIKSKHLKNLEKTIDGELAKENPDSVVLIRAWREKEICAESDCEKFWAEKALEGLSRASIDKPVIRKKLQDKIAELNGETIEPVIEEKKVAKVGRPKKNAQSEIV